MASLNCKLLLPVSFNERTCAIKTWCLSSPYLSLSLNTLPSLSLNTLTSCLKAVFPKTTTSSLSLDILYCKRLQETCSSWIVSRESEKERGKSFGISGAREGGKNYQWYVERTASFLLYFYLSFCYEILFVCNSVFHARTHCSKEGRWKGGQFKC